MNDRRNGLSLCMCVCGDVVIGPFSLLVGDTATTSWRLAIQFCIPTGILRNTSEIAIVDFLFENAKYCVWVSGRSYLGCRDLFFQAKILKNEKSLKNSFQKIFHEKTFQIGRFLSQAFTMESMMSMMKLTQEESDFLKK